MFGNRFLLAFACWALTVASPAIGQETTSGLFGATRPADDHLSLQLSMGEAFNSDVPAELRGFAPGTDSQLGRRTTMLAASADYARKSRRARVFGSASTFVRYAHDLERVAPGSQSAHVGADVRLPGQGNVMISQTAAYSPSYLYDLFPATTAAAPGEAIPANPEYRIDESESFSYRTRMAVGFGSPRATRLTTTAEYGLTDFKNWTRPRPNLTSYTTGATLSHAVSRSTALSIGYEYRRGEFGLGARAREHRVTMGVEYSPALSVSRRATFRVKVSPSTFDIPQGPGVEKWRLYPVQGEAGVDVPFRLKWRAGASYRRSVDYVPVLSEPTVGDGARLRLTGLIGRRIDLLASAGYASAKSVMAQSTRHLTTYTGEARVRYALARTFAVYAEYMYYSYDLGDQTPLVPGLPGTYEQRGVRVGFMVFSQPISR